MFIQKWTINDMLNQSTNVYYINRHFWQQKINFLKLEPYKNFSQIVSKIFNSETAIIF